MPLPLVDIVVTAHNAEPTIYSAISSLLAQSFASFRIIIIDDGSTDGTPELLERLRASDDRILVVRQAQAGIVAAANHGLQFCTAEFVARFDADDISFPQRLQRQVDHLRANPDCVAVSARCYHITHDGRRTGYIVSHDPDLADPADTPSREPYMMHTLLMMRREALERVGGYRPLQYAEDTDLYWRLQEIGRLDILPEVLGEYRLHSASVTSTSIVNGRVSAISSQMAGLSAVRRRNGRADIPFAAEDERDLKALGSFAAMYELAARKLDQAEAKYFRLALAAKLLELSAFRPWELEVSDCEFIRSAMGEGLARLEPKARRRVKGEWTHGAARLLAKGALDEFRALASDDIRTAAILRAGRLKVESRFPPKLIIQMKMWRRARKERRLAA